MHTDEEVTRWLDEHCEAWEVRPMDRGIWEGQAQMKLNMVVQGYSAADARRVLAWSLGMVEPQPCDCAKVVCHG
ncbi:MAG TPA: hypothetical protein DEB56_14500 [Thiobacillus sp.]|nr:hypothetical protein [Thiobacillus sp.]